MVIYTKESSKRKNKYYALNGYGVLKEYSCVYCGDLFKAKTPLAMYCSQRCQNDVNILKRKKQAQKLKNTTCLICNSNINESSKGRNKKYCSNKCKQKAYRVTK